MRIPCFAFLCAVAAQVVLGAGSSALAAPSRQGGLQILPLPQLPHYTLPKDDSLFLRADGTRLIDNAGQPFRIAAVNWYGAEEDNFIPGGLDQQSHMAILRKVHDLGYNTIRLPFSDQMVSQNPLVTQGVSADPELQNQPALTDLGIIIHDAGTLGLRVILDNHRSEAGWSAEGNGLWYNASAGYPEWLWLADWQILAALSLQWPNVIGMDLRDEPHTRGHAPWTAAMYATGATWGSGDPTYDPADPLNTYCTFSSNCHDWRMAAERAGDAILTINPRLLIFVEGVQLYLNGAAVDVGAWGGNLEGAGTYPVQFVVNGVDVTAGHLVYSPHEYGPSVFQNPNYGPSTTPAVFDALWQRFWGYLGIPGTANAAPLFIGEFGTCNTNALCTDSDQPGSQGQWFATLLAYLRAQPNISWSYWALNGTQSPAVGRQDGAPETYGLLNTDWTGVVDQQLQSELNTIQPSSS